MGNMLRPSPLLTGRQAVPTEGGAGRLPLSPAGRRRGERAKRDRQVII